MLLPKQIGYNVGGCYYSPPFRLDDNIACD